MSTFNSTTQRRWALLPLLALLHLGLGLLLAAQWRHNPPKPAAIERIEVRLLVRPAAKPLAAQAARFAAPAAARSPTFTARQAVVPSAPRPAPQAEQIADAEPPPEQTRETAAPGLLINSDATRRALRQATGSPLLSERAAQAMGDGPPLEQSVKLGQEIQKAGNGDCLKGEFAGGGAGLLSLPFWLLAEARGKCAR
ncbi:MAG: hypothetical protein IV107_04655 [Paucibacter sp.]|nr:hypothetical protein [Roseateles sp.]